MSRCTISDHFRGWECAICGRPMQPAHITTIDRLDVAVCAACCQAKHRIICFSTKNEAPSEPQSPEGGQR